MPLTLYPNVRVQHAHGKQRISGTTNHRPRRTSCTRTTPGRINTSVNATTQHRSTSQHNTTIDRLPHTTPQDAAKPQVSEKAMQQDCEGAMQHSNGARQHSKRGLQHPERAIRGSKAASRQGTNPREGSAGIMELRPAVEEDAAMSPERGCCRMQRKESSDIADSFELDDDGPAKRGRRRVQRVASSSIAESFELDDDSPTARGGSRMQREESSDIMQPLLFDFDDEGAAELGCTPGGPLEEEQRSVVGHST
ncbi:hypothetical protein FN846DRAFT_893418 [Sphaerosporella brunnea]|uniref:Uncharacterized protein n=1 Tax=Sphaerosporella brunnea TaxID=1250544 RepID=A0A5J5EM31_9PEZI|nr:hypothetical protein FN846DRAFT_893418 [Sphaerosporella brunnea]